ncbi:YihY/virulence factor BrkB family protein [Pinirhizobacter sp.]|uniref:YihY/virulence factor BrkB family protein n=1 Tax=Pinirhizobacter sp. TaxID=2950432 RepID=UPI002F3EE41A
MHPMAQRGWRIVRNTARGFGDDELMTRAAALAFYSALSFAPLLVLLLWIASSLRPEWQQQMIDGLNQMVGPRAAETTRLVLDNARQRPGVGSMAGIIGLFVTLVGASAVFAQLQGAINRVWSLQPKPGKAVMGWIRSRMHAVGLILALAFLLIVSFSVSALIAVFVQGGTVAWTALEAVVAMAVFVFVFAAIFKVLPDAVIAWRDALVGAALTAVLFAVGKFCIGLYLDHSNVGGPYGPAGSVVVLLVWVYYSALILLLGAELTEAVAEERGVAIQPRPHAMRVHVARPGQPPDSDF